MTTGSSRPSFFRSAATTDADALAPTSARAGSTGDNCRRKNTTAVSTIKTPTPATSRFANRPTTVDASFRSIGFPDSSIGEQVAHGVAGEVRHEHEHRDHHSGQHRYPPGVEQVGEPLLTHGAELGCGRRRAKPEKGQPR